MKKTSLWLKHAILFCCAISVCQASYGTVYFRDGNELYRSYTSPNISSNGFAAGYVIGVIDALATTKLKGCPLVGKEIGQLSDLVRLYLQDKPEIRDRTAATIVEAAIKEKLRC